MHAAAAQLLSANLSMKGSRRLRAIHLCGQNPPLIDDKQPRTTRQAELAFVETVLDAGCPTPANIKHQTVIMSRK